MRRLILLAFILSALNWQACRTLDGIPVGLAQEFGALLVSSNVDSARIFIDLNRRGDFADTGKMTRIDEAVRLDSLPVGLHALRLQRSCYTTGQDEFEVAISAQGEANLNAPMQLLPDAAGLVLLSTPDSALVFLDGLPQGYTPLTLTCLDVGAHLVEFRKGSYAPDTMAVTLTGGALDTLSRPLSLQRTVLMEHFSSSTCIPCVEADEIIESVGLQAGPAAVAAIGYHTEIPSSGDPMFLAARADNDARIEYYNVFTNPIVYIDGLVPELGVTNLRNRLNEEIDIRAAINPPLTLEFFDYRVGADSLSGRIRLEALQPLSGAFLRVAIVEKNIDYQNPPGSNGQTHFIDVLRAFWPEPRGTSLTMNAGEKRFVPFAVPLNSAWISGQLEVVAFVQVGSHEILQAASTQYP
ncbi:MAG TPA: PEGA domain-containing protein [Calditrichia bacterium]|nr:PEGA domain-containing protein [Calditrichia bacterium]